MLQWWVLGIVKHHPSLLYEPTHGDYYPGNLLEREGKITTIIDWDECRLEWYIYELARATWEFCLDQNNHTLDVDKARTFIKSLINLKEINPNMMSR